ncbi:hypothetical protein [Variovorax sp. RA8]|uniref:hypothetical protein n=1 Tax=Variovorax sp. (strain JCM 16519 / RA8) TaxID=662548 RepID=UPI0013A5AC93|nr:hypothetical protein [Variovorax sp. RA8]
MATCRSILMALPATDMKKKPSDLSLLESALSTIEQVLARADNDMQGAPYLGPTANLPLDVLQDSGSAVSDDRFRVSAAQSAINICLGSAAALIDVSQALMNRSADRSPQTLEREWQTIIAHTKIASRSAYRAALIMAAQKHVLAAQGEVQSESVYSGLAH